MSIAVNCSGCLFGDHSRHDRDHGIIPGLIGGQYCACTGDCAERYVVEQDRFNEEWGGLVDKVIPAGPYFIKAETPPPCRIHGTSKCASTCKGKKS